MNLPATTKFDADARRRFLAFYEDHGRFYMAAKAAGVCGETVRKTLKADEAFAAEFEECKGRFHDHVEEEIQRRAIEGYDEYVTNGRGLVMDPSDETGKTPLMQRRFSDRLLEFFTRRHIAEYRDKSSVDVNVTGGVLLVPAGMTAEEWKAKHGSPPAIDVTPGNKVEQSLPALGAGTPVR